MPHLAAGQSEEGGWGPLRGDALVAASARPRSTRRDIDPRRASCPRSPQPPAGTSDIIGAVSARREIEVWWLQLVGGIIELALGLWAAGYYGRSAVLLIAWVSAFAVIRGVRDIVLAFRVREHPAPVTS
jgi:hypothetical protein